MSKPRQVDVTWDTDGEEVDLPTRVTIPEDVTDEGIADYLSDEYGWLVEGWSYFFGEVS